MPGAAPRYRASLLAAAAAATNCVVAFVLLLSSRRSEDHPGDTQLLLSIARVHDSLNNLDKGVTFYKRALQIDPACVEAIACLASHHFYTDQPEVALRYYRRLVQMGVNNTELWNNLGLCCFYASQVRCLASEAHARATTPPLPSLTRWPTRRAHSV